MSKHIYYFKNGIHIKYNHRATTVEIDKLETTMGELLQEEFEVEYPGHDQDSIYRWKNESITF